MDDKFLKVATADGDPRTCFRWQRRPPSTEDTPHVAIPRGRLRRDVVQVDPLAKELLEEPV